MYKVLVITEEGRGGGALGRIRLIASELKEKIQTVVLAPKTADSYIQSLHAEGIETISTRVIPLSKNPLLLFKYLLSFIPEIWSM